jgi:hypothetical protein
VGSAALAAEASGLSWEVVVVDNGSSDHSGAVLDELSGALGPRLRTFRLGANLGTTRSRNLAAAHCRGRWFCVLDSDAELVDRDLGPVLALLDQEPEVGIVAPRILAPPDWRPYDSVKLLPTLADKLRKLPGVLARRPTVNTDWYPGFPFGRLRCVHTAISCCWFLRRDTWRRVGPVDERIFYAPEDVDYCLRAWKSGRAVVYFPHLRVRHHTRQVSHRRPFSRLARSHLAGIFYYLHKHGYWLRRGPVARQWIEPLAGRLQPRLEHWERARGLA